MGKGGTETSSQTSNMPPPWAAPLFSRSAHIAKNLFREKEGFGVYQGPQVAQFSGLTKDALNSFGQMDPNARIAGTGQLESMARGDNLQDGNPYFRQQLNSAVSDTARRLNSQFSASGRYGSAANTAAVGRETGNMLNQGLSDNYNREQQAQLQAANMLTQRSQNTFQNTMAANQAQLQAGNVIDRRSQAELQAEIARWNAEENQKWTRLGGLQAAASGSAGNYGTSSSSGQQSQSMNPMGPLGLLGSFALK